MIRWGCTLATEDEGKICANWVLWTDIKTIKKNGAIIEVEVGQVEREVLSWRKFCSHIKEGILNLISTSKSIWYLWLECKMAPPRQQCVLTTFLKNFKLSPHKHFVNLNCHRKAYPGSWLSMQNL